MVRSALAPALPAQTAVDEALIAGAALVAVVIAVVMVVVAAAMLVVVAVAVVAVVMAVLILVSAAAGKGGARRSQIKSTDAPIPCAHALVRVGVGKWSTAWTSMFVRSAGTLIQDIETGKFLTHLLHLSLCPLQRLLVSKYAGHI